MKVPVSESCVRRFGPEVLFFALLATLASPIGTHAAEADLVVEETEETKAELSADSQRMAEAMAHYLSGKLHEDIAGPERAFNSYRKVLDLDPGFEQLAIRVANDHLRRGDTAEALAVLKDAMKANPEDPNLPLATASIYLRQLGKPDLAERYARKAQELTPEDFAPYEALYEIYTEQKDTARADAILARASKVDTDEPTYWLELAEFHARALLQKNQPTEVEVARVGELYDKALSFSPDNAAAWNRVAEFYQYLEQPAKALPLYEKAYELSPDLPRLMDRLAETYAELGRIDEAIEMYEKIVSEESLKLGAYDRLFLLHLQKGDYDRAYTSIQQALILNPFEPARYQHATDMLFRLGRFDAAYKLLGEARERFPHIPDFARLQAIAATQSKRHEEAIRIFEQLLVEAGNIHPEFLNSNFYFEYGAAAEQAGRYTKAEELFRKSIELDPDNAARSYNYLGYMWVERNENLDEAEQLIRRALDLDPDSGAYIDSLGWLFYKKGRYEEALDQLLRAAELVEEPDPVVYDHIGDTYHQLGENGNALAYYRKAVSLDPENKEIQEKINRLEEARQIAVTSPTPQQTGGSRERE